MTTLEITVYGRPAPQGSKRHLGGGRMIEMSRHVKPWRQDVKAAAEVEITSRPGWLPLDEPLSVRMIFTLPKPASAPKRRRTWPCRTPDLSKLVRATEDALTDAGVWRDDARVVDLGARKVFPGEDHESLAAPGVRIVISTVDVADTEGTPA